MSRFGADQIFIRKLFFQQTGIFHDVVARPLELNADEDAITSLRSRILQDTSSRPTKENLRGIGARLLSPTMNVDTHRDRVFIPDGWDRPRCRFSMEVEVKKGVGGSETLFIQGFTDHFGMTDSGNIDPNMVMFINSFIRVTYNLHDTDFGREYVPVVKDVAQIASGKLLYDSERETQLIRPADTFAHQQRLQMSDGQRYELKDSRSRVNGSADSVFIKRGHNRSLDYLSEALSSYGNALSYQEMGTTDDDMVSMAQNTLSSDIETIKDNAFLRALGRLQGMADTTSFTLNDLLDMDPKAGSDAQIVGSVLDGRGRAQLANRDNCSRWDDTTLEASWAVQLQNGISSIMMDCFHTGIAFRATNKMSGRVDVLIADATPIAEGMPRYIFDKMVREIEFFLFDLSQAGRIDFDVNFEGNLFDQSLVELSLFTGREERFWVPSFADAYMSSLFTRRGDHVNRFVNDFKGIVDDISGEMSGSARALGNSGY